MHSRHGPLGLGEAFMDGWWTCEAVDQMIHRAIRDGIGDRFGSPTDIARVVKARSINLASTGHIARPVSASSA